MRSALNEKMKEQRANLWDLYRDRGSRDAFVITTNGSVTRGGLAVLGRGLALDAKTRFPKLPAQLGKLLLNENKPYYFPKEQLITFPVKHVWYHAADVTLIAQSCKYLNMLATLHTFDNIYVPRVGCGNGQLSWDVVQPILEKYLDGRYTIVWNGK